MWLRIQSEGGRFRVLWGNNVGPYRPSFQIGAESLHKMTDEVRGELHKLTAWSAGSDPTALPVLLKRLALAGSRLHYALFDFVDCNPADKDALRTWLAEQYAAGDTTLAVTADPDMSVPWGLL